MPYTVTKYYDGPIVSKAVTPTRQKPPAKGWTEAERGRYVAMRIADPDFLTRIQKSIEKRFDALMPRKG